MEAVAKLVIKTPNQRYDDLQIDCDLGWTVKKLKDYLSDVYPTKPVSKRSKYESNRSCLSFGTVAYFYQI